MTDGVGRREADTEKVGCVARAELEGVDEIVGHPSEVRVAEGARSPQRHGVVAVVRRPFDLVRKEARPRLPRPLTDPRIRIAVRLAGVAKRPDLPEVVLERLASEKCADSRDG